MVATEIIEAYKKTKYTAENGITLLIDAQSYELDKLLKTSGLKSAIYITAWNPFSKMKSSDQNNKMNKLLKSDLMMMVSEENIIDGFGEDPSGEWPGEKSFLALGILKEQGINLSEKYGQNAFVYHELDLKTELVLTVSQQEN